MPNYYANVDDLIADLMPEATSQAEIDAIERVTAGASDFVDRYCNRPAGYFLPASNTATARNFRGEGRRALRIPAHIRDSVTVTGIEASTYYESQDLGWLYFNAEVAPETGEVGSFDDYRIWQKGKLYEVTAKWGYAETPVAIVEAVRQIVVRWYKTARGSFGADQVTPSGFIAERDIPAAARAILDTYRKREFEIN